MAKIINKKEKVRKSETWDHAIVREEEKNPFLIRCLSGKSYKVNEDALAHSLITKYNFKTLFGKKSEELYAYDGKIYSSEKAKEIIKTEIEKAVGKYSRNQIVTEIFEKVKRLTAANVSEFDNIPLNLINFNNGVYDLEKDTLLPHLPIYPFRQIIPVDYKKEADCPEFKKFLGETLYESDIDLMQELFGFSLYRRYFIKKAAIFDGEKDTGKTVLLNVMMKLIGNSNTSGISLQRISAGDKFAIAALYNKLLNVYDDLSSKDLSDGGGFKICTGGGYVTAEYKFGDSFQFVTYAKQIFACNKIPPIKEDDDAYYGRWLIVEFPNQVPEDKQDKFLIDKITTPEELSGILNWSLIGLKRLLVNGKFSYTKSVDEIRRIMHRSSNPLAGFVQDCLIEKQGNKITKEHMYELYVLWVNAVGTSRLSKEQLGRSLGKFAKYALAKNDSQRYWENIGLNEPSIKNKIKLDTLDTFLKIISEYSGKEKKSDKNNEDIDECNKLDMISKEVSNLSKEADTLDTIPQKEIKQIDEDQEVS